MCAETSPTALTHAVICIVEAITSVVNGVGGGKDKGWSKEKDDHHGYQHKDSRKHLAEKQDELVDRKSEYGWRFCESIKMGDVLAKGAYFGINVHPFKTVFMKTNGDVDQVASEELANWVKGLSLLFITTASRRKPEIVIVPE